MKKENADVENLSMFDNFFKLLNLEQKFEIDYKQLDKNYTQLQQIFHPDKQINKNKLEKIFALEYAIKINEAYNILKDDKKRAEYLLFLEGIIINQEDGNNINPNKDILITMLDISENPNNYEIFDMKKECWEKFKHEFKEKNFQEAAQAIIKLQYLNKFT